MIENAKQAHAAGKVWVSLTINGGSVKLNADSKGSLGRIEIKGPYTAEHAMAIFKVATRDE